MFTDLKMILMREHMEKLSRNKWKQTKKKKKRIKEKLRNFRNGKPYI